MKIFYNKHPSFFDDLNNFLEDRHYNISEKIDLDVKKIVNEVKQKGNQALFNFSMEFDGIQLNNNNLLIPNKVRKDSKNKIDSKILKAFEKSIINVTDFHRKQIPKDYEMNENDVIKGCLWKPIQSVGLYVPGGHATYPSSLIMNVIPAKVAGVKRIVVVTPNSNKDINPYILALLDILEINEAYQIGGAQAIAALAYGTETIKPVNKIFGPGNSYVSSAKKQVFGKVGIDLIAGPSEIVVVADKNNNPKWVASDLIAQAEHDEKAQSILITNNENFSSMVKSNIDKLIKNLPKKNIIKKSIDNFGAIIIVDDFINTPEIIDLIAPEHLHLQNKSNQMIFDKIHNAGAIFLGEHSTEAFGDYIVGTNHILPTSGSAKFASGLGVLDFLKRSLYIKMNEKSSSELEGYVSQMASIEKLEGHQLSVKIRQKDKK